MVQSLLPTPAARLSAIPASSPASPSRERDEVAYDYALVADLTVREGWRGKGVGYALLQAAEQFAAANDARWLRIGALARNSRAVEVYETFGFAPRLIEFEKDLGRATSGADRPTTDATDPR